MPRPSRTVAGGGTKSTILSSNPLASWFKNRENAKKQKMEEAARQVSNNKAENEMQIVNILNSINFTDSMLPADKLDYKTNESQPYGDLEFAVMEAVELMSNNTYDYSGVDISRIDASILVIAKELKNAIETGDVNRAFAAKGGLITSIDQIRNKIPFIPDEMKKAFVENSESYLELWHTLITYCTSMDAIEKNLEAQKLSFEQKQNKLNKEQENFAKRLIQDEKFREKVDSIMGNTFIDNSRDWDQESMDTYKWLVNQRIEKSSVNFENLQYEMLVKQSAYQKKVIEDYQTRVRQIPVPTDPNLLNKYKDMVEAEYKKAAEIDAQFDELGEYMDNMDERLKQMASAKGSIRMQRMSAEAMEEIVERAKKIQMEEAGVNTEGNQMNMLKKIKLLTEEDIQKMKETQPAPQKTVNVNKTRERNMN